MQAGLHEEKGFYGFSLINLFAKPNEQNDACIKSAMARMPKASRTEAALSPKGRGADSGGESEAAKGGCEETNLPDSLHLPIAGDNMMLFLIFSLSLQQNHNFAMNTTQIIKQIRVYFNLMPDKEEEHDIIDQISSGVSFRGANLWILIFAIFIASLGLNVNSTAVIIGAMLISPLMGPIIGMGLAVGTNDLNLLKRAAKNYGVATLISVLTATLYFLLTPLSEAQSELLARTSPTLYDVLIAFCGGAAGIIALCTRGKGNVIPGVAIATALMPPLCTAGFGLATGHWLYFLGAFYLFFINTVFIALATFGGVRLMHFHRQKFKSAEQARKAKNILMSIVVVTMIPAIFMTVNIVHRSVFDNNVRKFIKNELAQSGTQIISNSIEDDDSVWTLRIVAVGKEITEATKAEAQRRMDLYHLGRYRLSIIQGVQSDSLLSLTNQLNKMTGNSNNEHQKLIELTAEAAALHQQLSDYTRYETLVPDVLNEIATLFPHIRSLSLAYTAEASRDTSVIHQFVTALIQTNTNKHLTPDESNRLRLWLQKRIKADSLIVVQK